MSNITSPLRYPGGKSSLTKFLTDVLAVNQLSGCTFIEPFCGGAGAALNLLFSGTVSKIIINDADFSIYAFWYSLLNSTEQLIECIYDTPITIEEWYIQKNTYLNSKDIFKRGFATFYLNRCNISGILKANPIGGLHQAGKWKINARFNKDNLVYKIKAIASKRDKIDVFCLDIFDFLNKIDLYCAEKKFIYFDPPYYKHGSKLYMNSFNNEQHHQLADFLKCSHINSWIMTYDDTEYIRSAYSYANIECFSLNYFAHKAKKGVELLIYPHGLAVPFLPKPKYGLAEHVQ